MMILEHLRAVFLGKDAKIILFTMANEVHNQKINKIYKTIHTKVAHYN